MQKGVILERNLTTTQCLRLSKNGIVIHTLGTGKSKEGDERLSYGSYMATLFIGNMYIGNARDITIWGPFRLVQLIYMNIVIEISDPELTFFNNKEN